MILKHLKEVDFSDSGDFEDIPDDYEYYTSRKEKKITREKDPPRAIWVRDINRLIYFRGKPLNPLVKSLQILIF